MPETGTMKISIHPLVTLYVSYICNHLKGNPPKETVLFISDCMDDKVPPF